MISNCGHDENGRYSGGQAGDQTDGEWQIQEWYNRPWNVVLRHPDNNIGAMIAELAIEAANNPNIGYDQNQRTSFYWNLKGVDWRPSRITTPCETDCSAGVAALVIATGHLMGDKNLQGISPDIYTGNERAALVSTGFEALTDEIYRTSARYLLPGDILLLEGHHTAINLDTGIYAETFQPHWIQDGDDWYYRIAKNKNAHGWLKIKNADGIYRWYHFRDNGCMDYGWFQVGDNWYYGEESGNLQGALWKSDDNGAQFRWEMHN